MNSGHERSAGPTLLFKDATPSPGGIQFESVPRLILELDGLVNRGAKATVPVTVEYSLTNTGPTLLAQRRRETGEIEPRRQVTFRPCLLAGREAQLRALVAAKPDQTLAELQTALRTTASLPTIWRKLERLELSFQKNRSRRRTTSA